MFRKTASLLARRPLNAFRVQQPRRFYATEASSSKNTETKTTKGSAPVSLFPELKRFLKPHVIETLEKKGDELLIRKLNFIGPEGVARLNCASKLVLDTLNDSNCFRIMSQELMDNWDYYWLKIKKSGNDSDLWLENLKEVEHLPFVMDKAFQRMRLSGVNPTIDHYVVYVNSMGKNGIGPQAGKMVLDLSQQNYARREQSIVPTRPGRLNAWSKHLTNEIPLIFYEYFNEQHETEISSEMHEHFKKLQKEHEEEIEIGNYLLGPKKNTPKPNILVKREEEYEKFAGTWMQQEMIDQYIQPPMDKLYNIQDKKREQLADKDKKGAKGKKA